MTATRRRSAGERQEPVVLDQDQRALGEGAGGARPRRRRAPRGSRRVGHVDVRLVEESRGGTSSAARGRRSRRGCASSTRPSARAASSGAPKATVRGSSAVDARDQGQPRRLAEIARQAVGGRDHLDADVVRGDDAVEAPLVAEDPGEQLGRGVARHAVHVAVGGHHARDARPARRPPRTGTAARRGAPVRRCGPAPGSGRPRPARGRPCAWPWRRRRRRGRAPGAPRCRRSRARRRGTGPRRTSPRSGPSAGRVRCRGPGARACRAPVSSIRRRIVAAIADDDVGIEARGGADRLLEARRGPGDQAVQALLVDDGRDPEPRPFDEVALDRVGGLGHLDRPQVGRARQPGDLADAVARRGRPAAPRRTRTRGRPRTPRTSRAGRPSRRGSSARAGRRRAPRPRAPGRGSSVSIVAISPSPIRP